MHITGASQVYHRHILNIQVHYRFNTGRENCRYITGTLEAHCRYLEGTVNACGDPAHKTAEAAEGDVILDQGLGEACISVVSTVFHLLYCEAPAAFSRGPVRPYGMYNAHTAHRSPTMEKRPSHVPLLFTTFP